MAKTEEQANEKQQPARPDPDLSGGSGGDEIKKEEPISVSIEGNPAFGGAMPHEEANIETLKAKIAESEQTAAAFKDQLLRKAAEFENYKKRIESDFAAIAKFSNEELLTELLPILDDFARSLKASKERSDFESFYRGIELIYNKFVKILETQGVKEIETVGKPFDVYYHEALMEIPKEGVPPHTIIEEVEKGYTFHDKVIRHAKVIVAAESPALKPHIPHSGTDVNPLAKNDGTEGGGNQSQAQQPKDEKGTTE